MPVPGEPGSPDSIVPQAGCRYQCTHRHSLGHVGSPADRPQDKRSRNPGPIAESAHPRDTSVMLLRGSPTICSFVEMSVIRHGRSGHAALRGDNSRPGLPVLPRTVISAATSRCRYGACLVGRSGSRPAPASGMLGSRAPEFWWPPRPRPFAPGLTPQIPNAWGHVAGPPLLRITATVIKVTEVTSQIRTTVRCRPRPWSSAFPRRRR